MRWLVACNPWPVDADTRDFRVSGSGPRGAPCRGEPASERDELPADPTLKRLEQPKISKPKLERKLADLIF